LRKDIIALRGEDVAGAEPLLKNAMARGKITAPLPSLEESRLTFLSEFAKLPEPIKSIQNPALYPVEQSADLQKLRAHVEQEIGRSH
jgi:nicotinate phosphoribosyltransferase